MVISDRRFDAHDAPMSLDQKIDGRVIAGSFGIPSRRAAYARLVIINGAKPCALDANSGRSMKNGTSGNGKQPAITVSLSPSVKLSPAKSPAAPHSSNSETSARARPAISALA